MSRSIDLTTHQMVALTRDSLAALRAALVRDAGPAAAAYLQEAGFAGGQALFESFRGWLAAKDAAEPEELDVEEFERLATDYFRDAGWGSLAIRSMSDAVAALDSSDWSEADPASGLDFPGCHLTTGMFAGFFGRLASSPLAVLEVECRSMGDSRCRFLIGSSDVMAFVYEQMGQGLGYEEAVLEVGAG